LGKPIASGLVLMVFLVAPVIAAAQGAGAQHGAMGSARHELGVDLSAAYSHESFTPSFNHFLIATPVDVRIGFMSRSRIMFEPRFAFTFDSKELVTGQSAYVFTPDLNVLFGKNQKNGLYLTAGAGVDLLHAAGASATQFGLNGGVGTRSPYESGAIRLEAFVQYRFKNTNKGLPTTLSIGGRIGLSLWH
jgi:hypothetical protein